MGCVSPRSEVTIVEQAKMSAGSCGGRTEEFGEKDESGSRPISAAGKRENLRGEEEEEGRKGAGHQQQ